MQRLQSELNTLEIQSSTWHRMQDMWREKALFSKGYLKKTMLRRKADSDSGPYNNEWKRRREHKISKNTIYNKQQW